MPKSINDQKYLQELYNDNEEEFIKNNKLLYSIYKNNTYQLPHITNGFYKNTSCYAQAMTNLIEYNNRKYKCGKIVLNMIKPYHYLDNYNDRKIQELYTSFHTNINCEIDFTTFTEYNTDMIYSRKICNTYKL